MKINLRLLIIICVLATVIFSVPTYSAIGKPVKKYNGICDESNKGKKTYYQVKYKIDTNRDGYYDHETIKHCDGTIKSRKINCKKITNSVGIEVDRETCTEQDIFELGFDHYASQIISSGEFVAIEYTNPEPDENGVQIVYIFPLFDQEVINMYIDQYVGLTIEQTYVYQDAATGFYLSELNVAGNNEVVGIEFSLLSGQPPIRIYFKPQN